jgi:signal transduction histidine kinase
MSIKSRLAFGLCFVAFLSLSFITLHYVTIENQIRAKSDAMFESVSAGLTAAPAGEQYIRAYRQIDLMIRRKFVVTVAVFAAAMVAIFLMGFSVTSRAVRDIDARRKIETEKNEICAQLIQTSRLACLGELAAGLCHEVGNLIQTILGNAELMIQGNGKDSIFTIRDSALSAKKLLSGLLDFARSPKMSFHKDDVRSVVESVLKIYSRQMVLQNIKIVRDYASDVPDITFCPAALQQVFLNILLNAQKAMPDGGELLIRVFFEARHVNIVFRDTGRGIKKEHLSEMFKPFFSDFPDGHGLGLSVSRRIIERHGGKIGIDSKGLGLGAEIRIQLPYDFKNPDAVTTS